MRRSTVVWTFLVASALALAARPVFADNLPPNCSAATPSVAQLWPPNHKFVDVSVEGVTDPDGDPVVVTVTGITQDEPLGSGDEGNACPDATGVGTPTAHVRAERSGQGDGRVYHVSFTADDGHGGVCTGAVAVCVPHDQGQGSVCVDHGPLVDSTTGAPLVPCTGDCGPEDCMPPPDDVAPDECEGESLPDGVEHRVSRAHDLLVHAGRADSRRARRLARKAARLARKAAASAAHAAEHGELSGDCAEALEERLDDAGKCAVCSAGD